MIVRIILLGFLFACPSGALFAHPGRTDSSGGHVNHKTGSYHKHSGGSSQWTSPSAYYYRPRYRSEPRTKYKTITRVRPRTTADRQKKAHADYEARHTRYTGNWIPTVIVVDGAEPLKAMDYVLLTTTVGSKPKYRVEMRPDGNILPDVSDLQVVAEAITDASQFMVFYFLPGMDVKGKAWALGSQTRTNPLRFRIYDDRAPSEYVRNVE